MFDSLYTGIYVSNIYLPDKTLSLILQWNGVNHTQLVSNILSFLFTKIGISFTLKINDMNSSFI